MYIVFNDKYCTTKLQLLVITLDAYVKNTMTNPIQIKWVNNMRVLFQTQNALSISLFDSVSFTKHLQSLLLFLLININQFCPLANNRHRIESLPQKNPTGQLEFYISKCPSVRVKKTIFFDPLLN